MKNFAPGPAWLSGLTEGNCSYKIRLSDGCTVCHNGDHKRKQTSNVDPRATVIAEDDPLMDPEVPSVPDHELPKDSNVSSPDPSPAVLRRSTCNCRPPDRFTI